MDFYIVITLENNVLLVSMNWRNDYKPNLDVHMGPDLYVCEHIPAF